MSTKPALLAIRFLLELAALGAFGLFGLRSTTSGMRYVWMLALPIAAAAVWGVFNVPGDPSRSGRAPVPVPGVVRLALELAFFGLAAWAGFRSGGRTFGLGILNTTLVLYALSYDRIAWLLKR